MSSSQTGSPERIDSRAIFASGQISVQMDGAQFNRSGAGCIIFVPCQIRPSVVFGASCCAWRPSSAARAATFALSLIWEYLSIIRVSCSNWAPDGVFGADRMKLRHIGGRLWDGSCFTIGFVGRCRVASSGPSRFHRRHRCRSLPEEEGGR